MKSNLIEIFLFVVICCILKITTADQQVKCAKCTGKNCNSGECNEGNCYVSYYYKDGREERGCLKLSISIGKYMNKCLDETESNYVDPGSYKVCFCDTKDYCNGGGQRNETMPSWTTPARKETTPPSRKNTDTTKKPGGTAATNGQTAMVGIIGINILMRLFW